MNEHEAAKQADERFDEVCDVMIASINEAREMFLGPDLEKEHPTTYYREIISKMAFVNNAAARICMDLSGALDLALEHKREEN